MAAAMHSDMPTLGRLLGSEAGEWSALTITDLVLDTRDVVPGAAFVALPGQQADGIRFASAALHSGAAIVLYDPAESPRPAVRTALPVAHLRARMGELARQFHGTGHTGVLAVTGTNGKTTVAWLLAQALERLGMGSGYIGTLGFGAPGQLHEHRLTTPDCLTLHREIRHLDSPLVALEASSHGLLQERLAGVNVAGAIFTNLSHDHLDTHGDLQNYAATKARLFAREELQFAVVNADDPMAAFMCARLPVRVPIIATSLGDPAPGVRDPQITLNARLTRESLEGLELAVTDSTAADALTLSSALIGRFNASNLLLVLGVLRAIDVPITAALEAVSGCRPPPGRMELFPAAAGPAIVVDYAHTPDALARALAAARALQPRRLWLVFGCGGERDKSKRPLMGAAAAAADRVILTDDNPRSEDPAAIIAGIRAGLPPLLPVEIIHDRRTAIESAFTAAAADDLVIVVGRGHEAMQWRHGSSVALSDRVIAAALTGAAA